MNKPNNYENVQAQGNFTPLREGGHALIIKGVEETKSKAGKDMIVVYFDCASDDSQPYYYQNLYDNDTREEKKWRGRMYILVNDEYGDTSRGFKTFTTSVEESNDGFEVVWGTGFCECFRGKRIGGVAGRVLDAYEGREIKKTEIRWFRSVERALAADIPDEYETAAHKQMTGTTPASADFMQIPDDAELPFL